MKQHLLCVPTIKEMETKHKIKLKNINFEKEVNNGTGKSFKTHVINVKTITVVWNSLTDERVNVLIFVVFFLLAEIKIQLFY